MEIRKKIKEHLKNREYGEALNFLQNNCNKKETKDKLNNILQNYRQLEQKSSQSSIDATSYYYSINQVVMDTLDVADEIVGEQDEDWDFIDDLVSSLKFNLLEPDQTNSNATFIEKQSTKDNITMQEQTENSTKNIPINEKITQLEKQLSKYEKLENNAKTSEEKTKYRDIIEAINSQIFEYLKKV